jgi:Ca2+-binding RTX toxin-like protein
MPHGKYHIREVVQSGWRQTSTPIVYTEDFAGVLIPDRDFGNTSCVYLYDVDDGTREVQAHNVGLLTITMSQGTFSVVRQDAQAFDAYDGAGGVLVGVTSVTSQLVDGVQRVDILIDPNDYLHSGGHPTPVGTIFDVSISGSGGAGTLGVLNAVNVDVANSLALQITGTECGELIVVGDDKVDGPNSDAKAIYFGTVSGEYNGGVDLTSEGIRYNKAIIDAMFDEPSISRVEVAALGGDDIIRVKDEILQQSMLNGGTGNDNIRGGSGKAQIFGGLGDDLLVGSFADDVIYGNAGRDWIFGGEGDDRAFGGADNDYIAGFLGNDALLKGDDGNDLISGGQGRDRLYGDAGFDIGYRDAVDLLIYQVEVVNDVPPDVVEMALLDLLEHYWNDNDPDAKDTLDELINDLVP